MNAAASVNAQRERIDRRAATFAVQLNTVLRGYARSATRAAILDATGLRVPLSLADEDADTRDLRERMARLLRLYGLRAAADAARRTAVEMGLNPDVLIPESLVAAAIAGKPIRIRIFEELASHVETRAEELARSTVEMVRESVRTIIADANDEERRPSAGEIARRIAWTLHGRDADDRAFVFSPQRAELIARTELTQMENTGIFSGYEAAGVDELEWLGYRDGRSGKRHHEKMVGQRVPLGTLFLTPLGNRLRYPGDPRAPIGDTARCRCTMRAHRLRRA